TILPNILSFLPTEQAVSTSVRWKYLFASLTNLHFDNSNSSSLVSPIDNGNAHKKFRNFICFVDRLLFLHYSSDIQTFHVTCYDDQGIDSFRANAWVSAILCRDVQELDLHFSLLEPSSFKLPGDLFTCDTLVVLKLSIRFKLNVPAMACLPSLKVLHLDYVIYASDDSIERLMIASCPVLEDFDTELFYWDNVPKFSISSPTLRRLTMVNGF
ncbi:LRR_2 domain-containing protein, partial [Cephalotus follicularis]